jgi:hypothetical protein
MNTSVSLYLSRASLRSLGAVIILPPLKFFSYAQNPGLCQRMVVTRHFARQGRNRRPECAIGTRARTFCCCLLRALLPKA